MSHYAVMVIRKKGNTKPIEEDLNRYDENREVELYITKTRAELIEDGKKTIEESRSYKLVQAILEGKTKEEWISLYLSDGRTESGIENSWNYYTKLAERIRKHDAGKLTDEDYYTYEVENWEGNEIDEDGNVLSSYNPESKWDWWVIGGRWSGELKIKPGKREEYDDQEAVDYAYVGDIDWEKMNSITQNEKDKAIRFWKYYVTEEEKYPGTKEDFIDEFIDEFGFALYKKEYFLERYKTVDEYLKSLSTWSVRAVLDNDGNWHEVGKMGWFGCSGESDEEYLKWQYEFYDNFIKPLDPEDIIAIIDCHI